MPLRPDLPEEIRSTKCDRGSGSTGRAQQHSHPVWDETTRGRFPEVPAERGTHTRSRGCASRVSKKWTGPHRKDGGSAHAQRFLNPREHCRHFAHHLSPVELGQQLLGTVGPWVQNDGGDDGEEEKGRGGRGEAAEGADRLEGPLCSGPRRLSHPTSHTSSIAQGAAGNLRPGQVRNWPLLTSVSGRNAHRPDRKATQGARTPGQERDQSGQRKGQRGAGAHP